MPNPPLVSICVPVYNKARHLGRTLEHILDQSYTHLEVVISDNGSNDGTADVIASFIARDKRIRAVHLPQTVTIMENWRIAMKLAAGDICKVQSADDPLARDFIEHMVQPLLNDATMDFSVCGDNVSFVDLPVNIDQAAVRQQYAQIDANCRELTRLADKRDRAIKLLSHSAIQNGLGNIYKVLFRRSCLPLKRWAHLKSSAPPCESFPDWDFLIRLFLNHRGFYVENVRAQFELSAASPVFKAMSDPQTRLAAFVAGLLLPMTVVTDPELRYLREQLQPQHYEQFFQILSQQIRGIIQQAQTADAAARKA